MRGFSLETVKTSWRYGCAVRTARLINPGVGGRDHVGAAELGADCWGSASEPAFRVDGLRFEDSDQLGAAVSANCLTPFDVEGPTYGFETFKNKLKTAGLYYLQGVGFERNQRGSGSASTTD